MRTLIAVLSVAALLALASCGNQTAPEQLPPEALSVDPASAAPPAWTATPAPLPQADLGVIVSSGVELDQPRPPPPDFAR